VVAPSTRPEAFGRTVVEAQAMGRPIIASDHGGARETIIPGATGSLVPPGDAAALAEAISRMIGLDASSRDRLGRQASAHVRENFTNDVMCASTLAVYGELLAESPVSAAGASDALRPGVV
jgi:glycosyltransferase involved in cell wall biosynthesis